MPLDYDKAYKERYRENVQLVKEQVRNGELHTKIHNFCELHDFSVEQVVEQINENEIVAVFFAKDPNKQKFHEHAAAEYIEGLVGITNFEALHHRQLSVVKGMVMSRDEMIRQGGSSDAKTIDFKWEYGGVQFYASHKYTKEEGGSQGNQYKDLQNFIKEAMPCTREDMLFLAIADGGFYRGVDGQAGVPRMQYLKNLALGSNGSVHACAINDLEELLPQLAKIDS